MSYIGQGLPADVFSGFTIDKFTGDGTANKALTLSKAPFSETTVLVTIDGVVQEPTDDFTVSGTTLTLVGTAANGSEINVTHLSGTVPSTLASKVDLNGVSDTLILDADADTTISADTDDQIDFKVGGTDILNITNSSSDAVISSMANDKDIIFKGQDGGSTITAFTLDMSAGGEAELRNGLTLADGDLTVASGHGINFAAAAGGTYADASGMASELLDDYEEGTWTGTFRTDAGHYTMQSSYTTGFYTRIGNIVSVNAYLAGQSEGLDDAHSVLIDGLPYVADSANSGYQAIAVGYANSLNSTAGQNIAGYTNKNTNQIQLTRFDLAGGTSSMTVGELTSDGEILFSCTYRVT